MYIVQRVEKKVNAVNSWIDIEGLPPNKTNICYSQRLAHAVFRVLTCTACEASRSRYKGVFMSYYLHAVC